MKSKYFLVTIYSHQEMEVDGEDNYSLQVFKRAREIGNPLQDKVFQTSLHPLRIF